MGVIRSVAVYGVLGAGCLGSSLAMAPPATAPSTLPASRPATQPALVPESLMVEYVQLSAAKDQPGLVDLEQRIQWYKKDAQEEDLRFLLRLDVLVTADTADLKGQTADRLLQLFRYCRDHKVPFDRKLLLESRWGVSSDASQTFFRQLGSERPLTAEQLDPWFVQSSVMALSVKREYKVAYALLQDVEKTLAAQVPGESVADAAKRSDTLKNINMQHLRLFGSANAPEQGLAFLQDKTAADFPPAQAETAAVMRCLFAQTVFQNTKLPKWKDVRDAAVKDYYAQYPQGPHREQLQSILQASSKEN